MCHNQIIIDPVFQNQLEQFKKCRYIKNSRKWTRIDFTTELAFKKYLANAQATFLYFLDFLRYPVIPSNFDYGTALFSLYLYVELLLLKSYRKRYRINNYFSIGINHLQQSTLTRFTSIIDTLHNYCTVWYIFSYNELNPHQNLATIRNRLIVNFAKSSILTLPRPRVTSLYLLEFWRCKLNFYCQLSFSY